MIELWATHLCTLKVNDENQNVVKFIFESFDMEKENDLSKRFTAMWKLKKHQE